MHLLQDSISCRLFVFGEFGDLAMRRAFRRFENLGRVLNDGMPMVHSGMPESYPSVNFLPM
jgi:hypothetical protein